MMHTKRTHAKPPVRVNLMLPAHVAEAIDEALFDPVYGKPAYGGRSALITKLLLQWLEEQKTSEKE